METVAIQKKTGLYWLWLSIFVIIVDQITKYLAILYLPYDHSLYLIPYLNLTLEHNTGAAFSFLSEMGSLATGLFIAIALIISLILCIWLHRLPARNYGLSSGLALILGGAIGNLIDRIYHGYVIDFIHFHINQWSWPVFNMADTAITIGAFLLILDIFKKK